MATFAELSFLKDPYNLPSDAAKIETRYIEWNREDLTNERISISAFVSDAAQGYKSSILAFGPIGSGKTWLGRLIEKEFLVGKPDGLVLKMRIMRMQPDFEAVYQTFIESFLEDGRALTLLGRTLTVQAEWHALFPNNGDLGNALYHVQVADESADTSRNWLRGATLPAGELKAAGISLRLGSPVQRYEVMLAVLEKCVELFPAVLLIVDELENAEPKFAREFGDLLRELLDAFGEKFALCCLFTGESLEDFYDRGYLETLLSRITFKVALGALQVAQAPGWLRKHQILYRSAGHPGDQMHPFTEAGFKRLIAVMDPAKMYPRNVLTNCGHLARQFKATDRAIDAAFVDRYLARLENRES